VADQDSGRFTREQRSVFIVSAAQDGKHTNRKWTVSYNATGDLTLLRGRAKSSPHTSLTAIESRSRGRAEKDISHKRPTGRDFVRAFQRHRNGIHPKKIRDKVVSEPFFFTTKADRTALSLGPGISYRGSLQAHPAVKLNVHRASSEMARSSS